MNNPRKQVDADRLFQAAEAVMVALSEIPLKRAEPITYERDFIGTPDDPKACWGFTTDEIEEAQAFLVRLGYLAVTKG